MVGQLRILLGFLTALWVGLTLILLHRQLPAGVGVIELFGQSDNLEVLLVQSYTLPRLAVALLAGGTLGFAALLLQQVLGNPLASDSTLGISSGAQFALFLTAVFTPSWLAWGANVIAALGAALSLVLVMTLAWRKTMPPLLLILAGLVVNLYLGSFSGMMMLFYPEESRGLAQWGAGSLVQESWRHTQLLLWQLLPCLMLTGLLVRPLAMLSLNDSNAQSLGVPVARLRLAGIAISAYLIAAVVSAVGMLGFIGLAAATMVRQFGVRRLPAQLGYAFALGALLLAVTDLLLQWLQQLYGMTLPTGAVTALLGTPLLLWLMFRALPPQGRITPVAVAGIRRVVSVKTLSVAAFAVFTAALVLAFGMGKLNGQWHWLNPFRQDSGIVEALFALRLPRVLTALSVGMLLAVAGTLLQRLTQNPMASPELLGISSGTGMGIVAVLFLFSSQNPTALWLAGIGGAVAALLLISAINARNGMLSEKVLLTGIALSALFDTLQRILIASGDPRANQLVAWASGSTQQMELNRALPLFVVALLLVGGSLVFVRWLNLLGLPSPVAQSLGLNLKRSRWVLIVFSALLSAVATLMIGPLSFIGLLVPHLTRFLGVRRVQEQLLLSALIGGVIMVLADWFGRQVLFPYEIPAGLVATLLGGTYFLLTMRKI